MRHILHITCLCILFVLGMGTAQANQLLREMFKYECANKTDYEITGLKCAQKRGSGSPVLVLTNTKKLADGSDAQQLQQYRVNQLIVRFLTAGGSMIELIDETQNIKKSCSKVRNRIQYLCNEPVSLN